MATQTPYLNQTPFEIEQLKKAKVVYEEEVEQKYVNIFEAWKIDPPQTRTMNTTKRPIGNVLPST